ncbi:hypothetical protein PAAL109150_13945 [Paenibacillus alkaliterrae]
MDWSDSIKTVREEFHKQRHSSIELVRVHAKY